MLYAFFDQNALAEDLVWRHPVHLLFEEVYFIYEFAWVADNAM